jgi:hypothetical protein
MEAKLTTATTAGSTLAYPVVSIRQGGSSGTKSYGYAVTGTDSAGGTITTNVYTVLGNITLSASNYNIITVAPWNTSGLFVAPVGACSVRRVTPSPVGTIGSIANCAGGGILNDAGQGPTDTTNPPQDTSGGSAGNRNVYASGPNSAFPDTLIIGGQGIALTHSSGTDGWFNTCVGFGPCGANTTGSYNTSVGADSFRYNTTGSYSTAMGVDALWLNTTGNDNSAFGMASLYRNTTGANNSAFGAYALNLNATSTNNSAFGYYALFANTADNNSAFGAQALQQNTTGTQNTAVGISTLYANTTGRYNTAVGAGSLASAGTADNNTAVGATALYAARGGSNTAVGTQAGYYMSSGANNSMLGTDALVMTSTGQSNTAVGYFAGFVNSAVANTTGSNNTWLGAQTGPASATQHNYQTALGAGAAADCDNCIVLGRSSDSLVAPGAVSTPASSSDACIAGQIAFDASYIYTCVATNSWRRAATAPW